MILSSNTRSFFSTLFLSLALGAGVIACGSSADPDPVCGNDIVEDGESCDDGDTQNGDGCSSSCDIEEDECGDAQVQSGEACDDGNTLNGDGCSSSCDIEGPSEAEQLNQAVAEAGQLPVEAPAYQASSRRRHTPNLPSKRKSARMGCEPPTQPRSSSHPQPSRSEGARRRI